MAPTPDVGSRRWRTARTHDRAGHDFLAGLRGGADPAWVRELAERLDLDLGRRIGVLSRGNKQKVGLVQALAHRPELAILDEPTSGLDPLVQQEVYGIVDELRAGGTTVFFSSHVLSEVDRVADRVGMIRAGRLIDVDDVGALRARALRRVEVRFADPVEPGAFANLPGVREVRAAGERASFAVEGSMDPLIKALAGFEVVSLDSHEADLEDVFLDLYASPAEASTQSEPSVSGRRTDAGAGESA